MHHCCLSANKYRPSGSPVSRKECGRHLGSLARPPHVPAEKFYTTNGRNRHKKKRLNRSSESLIAQRKDASLASASENTQIVDSEHHTFAPSLEGDILGATYWLKDLFVAHSLDIDHLKIDTSPKGTCVISLSHLDSPSFFASHKSDLYPN